MTCLWPWLAVHAGRELMVEMQRKREAERKRFAELGKDVTGRGAQTVRESSLSPSLAAVPTRVVRAACCCCFETRLALPHPT